MEFKEIQNTLSPEDQMLTIPLKGDYFKTEEFRCVLKKRVKKFLNHPFSIRPCGHQEIFKKFNIDLKIKTTIQEILNFHRNRLNTKEETIEIPGSAARYIISSNEIIKGYEYENILLNEKQIQHIHAIFQRKPNDFDIRHTVPRAPSVRFLVDIRSQYTQSIAYLYDKNYPQVDFQKITGPQSPTHTYFSPSLFFAKNYLFTKKWATPVDHPSKYIISALYNGKEKNPIYLDYLIGSHFASTALCTTEMISIVVNECFREDSYLGLFEKNQNPITAINHLLSQEVEIIPSTQDPLAWVKMNYLYTCGHRSLRHVEQESFHFCFIYDQELLDNLLYTISRHFPQKKEAVLAFLFTTFFTLSRISFLDTTLPVTLPFLAKKIDTSCSHPLFTALQYTLNASKPIELLLNILPLIGLAYASSDEQKSTLVRFGKEGFFCKWKLTEENEQDFYVLMPMPNKEVLDKIIIEHLPYIEEILNIFPLPEKIKWKSSSMAGKENVYRFSILNLCDHLLASFGKKSPKLSNWLFITAYNLGAPWQLSLLFPHLKLPCYKEALPSFFLHFLLENKMYDLVLLFCKDAGCDVIGTPFSTFESMINYPAPQLTKYLLKEGKRSLLDEIKIKTPSISYLIDTDHLLKSRPEQFILLISNYLENHAKTLSRSVEKKIIKIIHSLPLKYWLSLFLVKRLKKELINNQKRCLEVQKLLFNQESDIEPSIDTWALEMIKGHFSDEIKINMLTDYLRFTKNEIRKKTLFKGIQEWDSHFFKFAIDQLMNATNLNIYSDRLLLLQVRGSVDFSAQDDLLAQEFLKISFLEPIDWIPFLSLNCFNKNNLNALQELIRQNSSLRKKIIQSLRLNTYLMSSFTLNQSLESFKFYISLLLEEPQKEYSEIILNLLKDPSYQPLLNQFPGDFFSKCLEEVLYTKDARLLFQLRQCCLEKELRVDPLLAPLIASLKNKEAFLWIAHYLSSNQAFHWNVAFASFLKQFKLYAHLLPSKEAEKILIKVLSNSETDKEVYKKTIRAFAYLFALPYLKEKNVQDIESKIKNIKKIVKNQEYQFFAEYELISHFLFAASQNALYFSENSLNSMDDAINRAVNLSYRLYNDLTSSLIISIIKYILYGPRKKNIDYLCTYLSKEEKRTPVIISASLHNKKAAIQSLISSLLAYNGYVTLYSKSEWLSKIPLSSIPAPYQLFSKKNLSEKAEFCDIPPILQFPLRILIKNKIFKKILKESSLHLTLDTLNFKMKYLFHLLNNKDVSDSKENTEIDSLFISTFKEVTEKLEQGYEKFKDANNLFFQIDQRLCLLYSTFRTLELLLGTSKSPIKNLTFFYKKLSRLCLKQLKDAYCFSLDENKQELTFTEEPYASSLLTLMHLLFYARLAESHEKHFKNQKFIQNFIYCLLDHIKYFKYNYHENKLKNLFNIHWKLIEKVLVNPDNTPKKELFETIIKVRSEMLKECQKLTQKEASLVDYIPALLLDQSIQIQIISQKEVAKKWGPINLTEGIPLRKYYSPQQQILKGIKMVWNSFLRKKNGVIETIKFIWNI